MASLFEGTPQTATSYATTSTETPKWMQDAIYNQLQWATGVANAPYQAYQMPTVAELSPLQQQAYSQVQQNQGAWLPALNQSITGMTNLANKSSLATAQPFINAASASAASGIGNYISPYQQNVMDVIAKQGARNLTENLLPNISDAFIKAGQFGGNRMGEFGSRAIRDTQEAILAKQADLANQGYNQALNASQNDLSRIASIGQNVGQMATNDIGTSQAALTNLANLSKQGQSMTTADIAALESAGQAQQAQQQKQLDSAYNQYLLAQQYPKNQLDWLNAQIRGLPANTIPTSTNQSTSSTGNTYSASPLMQLASGMSLYKGLTG